MSETLPRANWRDRGRPRAVAALDGRALHRDAKARSLFTGAERGLVAGAAAIVFTRVFAFSVTTLGFTEYARGLVGSGTAQADAKDRKSVV